MPVNIPRALPARKTLQSEGVFVMSEERAGHQDVRPLEIAIVNLMPTKITTETQLLRLLGNTPIQVRVTLIQMGSHSPKNTSPEHMDTFYAKFAEIKDRKFDGLIITGAPIETLPFEDVTYWAELQAIMDWSHDHVFANLYVCWGAQAALYHFYGVDKHRVDKKVFGVFQHDVLDPNSPMTRGFDEVFPAPHSRHTEVHAADIDAVSGLVLLATSSEAGVYLAGSADSRQLFVTGHPEYERTTLAAEYQRDVARGLDVEVPKHYFPNDDPSQPPKMTWRSHAYLLYANWLNYAVYQRTPFDPSAIGQD